MDLQIIQSKIYEIRGCRVMLDSDLAALYQVETKALKQAVKRNIERFPSDFMFELTLLPEKRTGRKMLFGLRLRQRAFPGKPISPLSVRMAVFILSMRSTHMNRKCSTLK